MTRWVYDIVRNKSNQIVALCYHQIDEQGETDCLGWPNTRVELHKEGLTLELSAVFDTLEEARSFAWSERKQFHPSLD